MYGQGNPVFLPVFLWFRWIRWIRWFRWFRWCRPLLGADPHKSEVVVTWVISKRS